MFPRNWRTILLLATPAVILGILVGSALASPRPVAVFLDGQKVNLAVPARLVKQEPMVPARGRCLAGCSPARVRRLPPHPAGLVDEAGGQGVALG